MKKASLWIVAALLLAALLGGCAKPAPAPTAFSTASPAPAATPAPVAGGELADGVYPITVRSSSSMFRIVDAQLIVENGAMHCVMTMSGQGYGMLYMGTGKEALADSEKNYIPFVLDDNGAKTFTVPVSMLNMELDCAAWSIKKEKWYDRTLVFLWEDIPTEAVLAE